MENILEKLLIYAHKNSATDLHICTGSVPLIRKNGALEIIPNVIVTMPEQINNILDEILDEDKFKTLQEKKTIDFSFSKAGLGRFRTNIYSQRGTFAIAMRMLPFVIPDISELGLPKIIKTFATKSKGLFLATGATGSGKSTTLASLINLINETERYHILTIEDPIEYLHKHKKSLVTQREIGQDAPSFLDALRAALREDPDVIMVGEMRDAETIQIALTAAETGHLVFSTLHTVGAAKSIDRIIDAFPPAQHNQVKTQLATVLEGIVSQQLLPRIDGEGLAVASEVMITNSAIRNLIREGKHYQINSIIQTGQNEGMQLMESDLANLYLKGIVSKEEILFTSQNPSALSQFISRR